MQMIRPTCFVVFLILSVFVQKVVYLSFFHFETPRYGGKDANNKGDAFITLLVFLFRNKEKNHKIIPIVLKSPKVKEFTFVSKGLQEAPAS